LLKYFACPNIKKCQKRKIIMPSTRHSEEGQSRIYPVFADLDGDEFCIYWIKQDGKMDNNDKLWF